MGVLRLIDIETRNNHFTVVLSVHPELGFEARYWSTPRFPDRAYSRVESQMSGNIRDANSDSAVYLALARIEAADGPVLKVTENQMDGHAISFIAERPKLGARRR